MRAWQTWSWIPRSERDTPHWLRAGPTVAAALDEACDAVAARGAPAAAAELAEQARRLTPETASEDLRRRSLQAADWYLRAGEAGRARALLTELVDISRPGPGRAQALLRLARLEMLNHEFGLAIDRFQAALPEAGDDLPLQVEAEDGLGWSFHLNGQEQLAEGHASAALELARRLGDSQAHAEELALLGLVQFHLGRGIPHELMERSLALERWTPGERVLRHPAYALGGILARADEPDAARSQLEVVLRRAREYGDESALALIEYQLALVSLFEGDFDQALAHVEDGYEAAVLADQKPQQSFLLALRAVVEAHRGDSDAGRAAADQAQKLAGAAGNPRAGRTATWALGLLALSLGDNAEADRLLWPDTDWALQEGIAEPANMLFVPDEIEALIALGRLDDAEPVLREFESRALAVNRLSALAASARSQGLLRAARSDLEGAFSAFEQGLDLHALLRQPFSEARTLLALGSVQRQARQRRAARKTLGRAFAIFDQLGAEIWADRTRAELGRIGGRAPSAGGLTPTERRVAELVAEGRSNKEVAAELVVSVHTERRACGRSRSVPLRRVLGRVKGRGGKAKYDPLSNCSGDQPFWARRLSR